MPRDAIPELEAHDRALIESEQVVELVTEAAIPKVQDEAVGESEIHAAHGQAERNFWW